jgi:hyperosmotically inducible periplasmic protein
MKKLIMLAVLSLAVVSCERMDNKKTTTTTRETQRTDVRPDNTGRNVRDRNNEAVTSFNQSESEADRTITQKIRRALMDDNALSTNAKNVKVITRNGVVTLRGPVATADEKNSIEQKANSVQGVTKVNNQIEVTQNQ